MLAKENYWSGIARTKFHAVAEPMRDGLNYRAVCGTIVHKAPDGPRFDELHPDACKYCVRLTGGTAVREESPLRTQSSGG